MNSRAPGRLVCLLLLFLFTCISPPWSPMNSLSLFHPLQLLSPRLNFLGGALFLLLPGLKNRKYKCAKKKSGWFFHPRDSRRQWFAGVQFGCTIPLWTTERREFYKNSYSRNGYQFEWNIEIISQTFKRRYKYHSKYKSSTDGQTWTRTKRPIEVLKARQPNSSSKFGLGVCNVWCYAWEVYLLDKKLWFCHVQ